MRVSLCRSGKLQKELGPVFFLQNFQKKIKLKAWLEYGTDLDEILRSGNFSVTLSWKRRPHNKWFKQNKIAFNEMLVNSINVEINENELFFILCYILSQVKPEEETSQTLILNEKNRQKKIAKYFSGFFAIPNLLRIFPQRWNPSKFLKLLPFRWIKKMRD